MLQYIPNILKSTGRRQWFFMAVLSAFSLIGSNDTYHYELEGSVPVTTEQGFCPILLDNLSVLDMDLQESPSKFPAQNQHYLSVRPLDQLKAQHQKIQTAFEQSSVNWSSIELTVIYPKKIPTEDFEEALANL